MVCEAMKRHGIDVVLTGGAVVSIYTHNEYQSADLDFILQGIAKNVEPPMKELGFTRTQGRFFSHPDTSFTVEFPSGPLMVGERPVTDIDEMKTKAGCLRLLPPTECVMDRLSAYFHFRDPQALEQALLVAKAHPVKLSVVKKWSKDEGELKKYEEFVRRIKSDCRAHNLSGEAEVYLLGKLRIDPIFF